MDDFAFFDLEPHLLFRPAFVARPTSEAREGVLLTRLPPLMLARRAPRLALARLSGPTLEPAEAAAELSEAVGGKAPGRVGSEECACAMRRGVSSCSALPDPFAMSPAFAFSAAASSFADASAFGGRRELGDADLLVGLREPMAMVDSREPGAFECRRPSSPPEGRSGGRTAREAIS